LISTMILLTTLITKNMTIQEIKNNYQYSYAFIDFKGTEEVDGYIYNIDRKQYFIDNKETYFKIIDSE